MCKAIEDMKTESENIGYVKGVETNQKEMIEALKASGVSDALISDALRYMERKKKEEFKA